MQRTVSLHTLGCKLNYSETSTISKQFETRGFTLKEFGVPSDVFVLNTCSVTDKADKECRQIIRGVLRKNPDTYVIVTGCYAQLDPDEISRIEGVDLILGMNEKFKILDYVENVRFDEISCTGKVYEKPGIHTTPIAEVFEFDEAFSSDIDSRTRAFLKIQDGCDYKCAFCTIPIARGKSRSPEIKKIVENAQRVIDSGYKEIVLTGVNTGDYKFENKYFIDVLEELNNLDIPRIRISSIEPNLLTDEIISLVASSEKFCSHFHIPLQSGDPDILRLMKRRYNTDYFEGLIYKLKESIPNVGIGIDVIVGFPGETEKHFQNTYDFLNSLPFSYLHVFTYSERRNTAAFGFKDKIEIKERKKRNEILRNLSNKKKFEFYSKYTGSNQKVLFESKITETNGEEILEGWTQNYIRVVTGYDIALENTIVTVRLTEADGINPVKCEILNNYKLAEGY